MVLRIIVATMFFWIAAKPVWAGSEGIKQGASLVMAGAGTAMAANAIAGVICAEKGKAAKAREDMPTAAMFMAMAMMSFAQAGADGSGAGAAEHLGNTTSYGQTGNNSNVPTPEEMKKSIDLINKEGVKYNQKTGKIDTPYGSFSPAALSSPSKAALEGMSPEMQSALDKVLGEMKEIEKEVSAKLNSSTIAGDSDEFNNLGGGGSGASGTATTSAYDQWLKARNQKARAPSSLDGMKKYLKGDVPVGIAVDNIFEMIRRKYNQKNKENRFL